MNYLTSYIVFFVMKVPFLIRSIDVSLSYRHASFSVSKSVSWDNNNSHRLQLITTFILPHLVCLVCRGWDRSLVTRSTRADSVVSGFGCYISMISNSMLCHLNLRSVIVRNPFWLTIILSDFDVLSSAQVLIPFALHSSRCDYLTIHNTFSFNTLFPEHSIHIFSIIMAAKYS